MDWGRKVNTEKIGGKPYLEAFIRLFRSLVLVRELHKELPKSIKKIVNDREKAIKEKEKRLSEESKKQLAEILKRPRPLMEGNEKIDEEKSQRYEEDTLEFLLEFLKTAEFSLGSIDFIREMSLVYLIAEFEGFLRNVLEITFQKRPEILSSSKKSIPYEELVKFKRIDDALQQIIEKEASSIVNESIEKIDKYFENKFKAKLSENTDWQGFKERFHRRNILVHNAGMTNSTYRLRTGFKGKDKRMYVSKKYLEKSIRLFEDLGYWVSEYFESKFK